MALSVFLHTMECKIAAKMLAGLKPLRHTHVTTTALFVNELFDEAI